MSPAMRKRLFLAASVAILVLLNHAVWQQERIRARGDTVLLELAPVDPRSLIQGDYMALRYTLERVEDPAPPGASALVVTIDDNRVARFVRFDGDAPLAPGEVRLPFTRDRGRITIRPDSFLFQEGHAELYRDARFGVFKVAPGAAPALIGLAGADHRLITPPGSPVEDAP